MATSKAMRHMLLRGLALYAQRLGKVFASATTWVRLIRQKGWIRPRTRIHPFGPEVGIRATRPNQIWHIDVTVIRLAAFYVGENNSVIPHSAFRGQTPDEMYYGEPFDVPARLAEGHRQALDARMAANRASQCETCAPSPPSETGPPVLGTQ